MDDGVCELCGKVSQLELLEIHHVVPQEVIEQMGISSPATTILCHKCHQEIHDWYDRNVSTVSYHPESQSFQRKSPTAMVREYQSAYRVFAEYKKTQRNKVWNPQ